MNHPAPPTPSLHEQPLPAIDTLDALVAMVTDDDQLFLRYSKGPEVDNADGPSRDYEADVLLPGLSVTTISPEPWWPRPPADWIARRIRKYSELGEAEGRFAWLLKGTVVGVGPDHEPLVVDVLPVARLSNHTLDEAAQLYRNRFHVGRDSTV
jgi:hypothetical protein